MTRKELLNLFFVLVGAVLVCGIFVGAYKITDTQASSALPSCQEAKLGENCEIPRDPKLLALQDKMFPEVYGGNLMVVDWQTDGVDYTVTMLRDQFIGLKVNDEDLGIAFWSHSNDLSGRIVMAREARFEIPDGWSGYFKSGEGEPETTQPEKDRLQKIHNAYMSEVYKHFGIADDSQPALPTQSPAAPK